MPITSNSTKEFPKTRPSTVNAVEVETIAFIIKFRDNFGCIKQIFKDADGNKLGARFLKVSGAKYDAVAGSIANKIQTVTNNIEADGSTIDGVEIEQIDRTEFLSAIRGR